MKTIEQLNQIKFLFLSDQIDYNEAKQKAKPLIEKLNQEMEEVAKRFNRKSHKVSFIGFMR